MLRRRNKRHAESKDDKESTLQRKKQTISENGGDEAEEELEKLVFGRGGHLDLFNDLGVERTESKSRESDIEEDEDEENPTKIQIHRGRQRKPAWEDEGDEQVSVDITSVSHLKKLRKTKEETILSGNKYSQRLRTQFEKIYGSADWADLDKRKTPESEDEEENDEEDVLQRTGNYLSSKTDALPKGLIDVIRVKDANAAKPSNATIQALEFHPSAKVLLTAGFNSTLELFQIDGQTNPKIQSVFVKGFPIHNAHFSADGEQVIMASRRSFFYVYDMIKGEITRIPGIRGRTEKSFESLHVSPDGKHLVFKGNRGYIILVSSKTKQWIANLKMNGRVNSIAFSADGSRLFAAGSDGEVYVWDMNTRSCVHKFTDEGCLTATSLAVSRDGQYIACGSDSGVVNVYDNQCLFQSRPKPLKSVMNLTTCIDRTLFNSSSEILGFCSKNKKDSLKLVHLPSLTVFSNWPTSKTPLGYVNALDFSPNSGYLSTGNDKGVALLYRIPEVRRIVGSDRKS